MRQLQEGERRDEFFTRLDIGQRRVALWFRLNEFLVPEIYSLQELHKWLYAHIYTHAGDIRSEGCVADFSYMRASEAEVILPALRELEYQAHGWFHPRGLECGCEAVAKYNAELVRIRPFRDGTQVISVLVAQKQLNSICLRELGRNVENLELPGNPHEYQRLLRQPIEFAAHERAHEGLKEFLIDCAGLRHEVEKEREMEKTRDRSR